MLNGKNIKVLELLFQEKFTMDDIAGILNLNPRTIRYNIKDINSTLVKHNLHEIQKDKDLLYLNKKEIFKIKKLISSNSTLTSIDRRDYLLTKLLLNHEIVLSHESEILDVTRRTLNYDLLEAKKFLKDYLLDVEAIPGKGVKIYGNPQRINALLIAFLTKFLSSGINLKSIFKNIIFSLVEEKKLEEILFKFNSFLDKTNKTPEPYSFYAVISIIILSFTNKEDKNFSYNLNEIHADEFKKLKNFLNDELEISLPDNYIYVIIEILKNTYISDFERDLENNIDNFFNDLEKSVFKTFKMDKEFKKNLLALLRIADYKARFDIIEKNIEIYDLPKTDLELFNTFQELLHKYFRNFEIEDVILLSRMIQDKIQQQKCKTKRKVIVIDNSLNQYIGRKIGKFLEQIYDFEIIQYLPLHKVKYFLSIEKKVDIIVSLTNLEFEIKNIPVYEIEIKKFWQNFKLLEDE